MRLIHTTDLCFKEFLELGGFQYAILSYRWSTQEVTFEEFQICTPQERTGHGWEKILKGCEIARSQGIEWFWIDTCCIDKRSSAELSEAINSMFNWYRHAKICYVFLNDVQISDGSRQTFSAVPFGSYLGQHRLKFHRTQFFESEWFSRGWTLQELLAPRQLEFYSNDFRFFATKDDVRKLIAKVTGIPIRIIADRDEIEGTAIAERFSWAAKRVTTRGEDRAYSLMGLCNVSMPFLYGEGEEKAFVRLQSEMINKWEDESIFAWPSSNLGRSLSWSLAPEHLGPTVNLRQKKRQGLLAPSPSAFDDSDLPPRIGNAEIVNKEIFFRRAYAMTNKGLELTLDLATDLLWSRKPLLTLLMPLNCRYTIGNEANKRERLIVLELRTRIVSKDMDEPMFVVLSRDTYLSDDIYPASDSSLPHDLRDRFLTCDADFVIGTKDRPTSRCRLYIPQDGR